MAYSNKRMKQALKAIEIPPRPPDEPMEYGSQFMKAGNRDAQTGGGAMPETFAENYVQRSVDSWSGQSGTPPVGMSKLNQNDILRAANREVKRKKKQPDDMDTVKFREAMRQRGPGPTKG